MCRRHTDHNFSADSHHIAAELMSKSTINSAYWEDCQCAAVILMSGQGRSSLPIEINAGRDSHAVTFSANGEHLLSGGRYPNIGVWRVRDSQVATIEAQNVLCLAVSKNGSWIAAGTYWGDVFVWDSETHERVFEHKQGYRTIRAIDFSPDSTRLIWASEDTTATVWDVNTRKQVKTLRHEGPVIAAKFSPRGDCIATATQYAVRVWNSNFDNVHIPIRVTPCYNNGLAWSNDHLYAVSGSNIKQLDPSTGSTLSEWSIPGSSDHSCIALLEHGKFMAYSTNRTLMFWDMSTHAQLPSTEHHGNINSIALSPGDRLIAICGEDGRVVFKSLPRITVSTVPRWIMACLTLRSYFHTEFNHTVLSTSHPSGSRHSD